MLTLLKVRKPLDHRREPARGRILQADREELVVHREFHLLGASSDVHARRGDPHAGEREQRGVGLAGEERDDAGRLFEREEPADCACARSVRVRGERSRER